MRAFILLISLSLLLMSVQACFYDPGPSDTCIICAFDYYKTSEDCQSFCEGVAKDTGVDNTYVFEASSGDCALAMATSCQNAADSLDFDLSSAVCNSDGIDAINSYICRNDFANGILPDSFLPDCQSSPSTPDIPSTDSSPAENTPANQQINSVPSAPINIPEVVADNTPDYNDPLDPVNNNP